MSELKPYRKNGPVAKALKSGKLTRMPVDFRYDALNPEFEKMLAMIASYADGKYGDCHLYAKLPDRLRGEKSPVNHMREHLRQYMAGELYDHFDGDRAWHLAAIAYNAMMELFFLRKFGFELHTLTQPANDLDRRKKKRWPSTKRRSSSPSHARATASPPKRSRR